MMQLFQRLDSRFVFIILTCLLIPAAILFRNSASALLILIFLVGVGDNLRNKKIFKLSLMPLEFVFFLLIGWAYCSCLWSLEPQVSLMTSLRFTFMSGAGIFVLRFTQNFKENHLDFLHKLLPICFCISLSMVGFILFNKYFFLSDIRKIYFNSKALDHAISLLAIFMWLIIYLLTKKNKNLLAVLFLGGSFFIIIFQGNHTAFFAALLGFIIWLGSYFSPLRWIRVMKVVVPLFMLMAPLLPKTILSPEVIYRRTQGVQIKSSFAHRLYIWSLISERIAQHPWRGQGIGASKIQYKRLKESKEGQLNNLNFTNFMPETDIEKEIAGTASHPHNASLQIWEELGIIGIGLAIIIIVLIMRAIESIKQQDAQRMALTAFIAALTIYHSSYGLWQTWWIASLWIITILVGLLVREKDFQ